MSDAPDRIAAWPDFDGQYSVTGQWSTNTHPENAVAYVRADLSDALLREAMGALDDRDGGSHDADCKSFRSWAPNHCNCGHERARATLAKLRAHLEDR